MKIIVIGGTGHIGTYLIPRLVHAGHDVICVSRQQHKPYREHSAWSAVKTVQIDRELAEKEGTFGKQIKQLDAEVIIDLICFTTDSARQLVESVADHVRHFIHCGTIWVHGHSEAVPTSEDQPRKPFGEYGVQKAAIEKYLLDLHRTSGFPATILHPGHIVGTGWPPLNPAGHFNINVFKDLAEGRKLAIPNLGMETVHHVHADDVAQAFEKSILHQSQAIGESFHIVSGQAMTLRGFAMAISAHYGKKANLEFLNWDTWCKTVTEAEAEATWDHIAHSPNCSIAKAQRLIDYAPNYSSLQAVCEAIDFLLPQYDPLKEENTKSV